MRVPWPAVAREGAARQPPTLHLTPTTSASTKRVARPLGVAPGARGATKMQVLARNDQPHRPCAISGVRATKPCALCHQHADNDCWYRDGCASQHTCSFLPVVNSPRVGLCAYTASNH